MNTLFMVALIVEAVFGVGFLVAPGDVDGLANRIMRLADDPGLRHSLGAAALERAQLHFSLDQHVDTMERILMTAVDYHQRERGRVR